MTTESQATNTIPQESRAFGARSTVVASVFLILSLLAMRFTGLRFAVPFSLVFLIVMVFPFAILVSGVIGWLENAGLPAEWKVVVGPLVGLATLCGYWPERGWFLYAALITWSCVGAWYVAGSHYDAVRPMMSAVMMVCAIYVIIWNANYLALLASRSRLHDASIRALDELVYSAIVRRPITYEGWFPLVHAPWLITIFERAYLALFAEVALVLVLLARRTESLRWFVARLVACYAGGLLLFVLWPIAGPYLVYPSSISATFTSPHTQAIMRSSLIEFSAIRFGAQPITGFGYFVGFPSLHVAMAALSQFTIHQRSSSGGWVVAPINALMIASTFVLGYHYLADVVGGILLASAAIGLVRRQT